ncbi:uncharacterized protein DUF4247 [Aneurinibacillus soli]|uniref:Uncharacterized protein n=1 Tax=Aneurinibacillus soli TaxID=1500254 RepID=A0A0U4NGD9_9BACL|nr:DUF4247 domain-containing protein [Aneurinibacillus soli]PYE61359.1 uncharacterized protein DUF4247 [Aneurinibacillus soli]BAU27812.1 hypothetical protein CB4_01986 [Aneurinibacillus soli]
MVKRLLTSVKVILIGALLALTLTGCGGEAAENSYPLESITQNGQQQSKVYRAENKTVPQVAEELRQQEEPKEISKTDTERMFLVYPDKWYHLQKDPKKPEDTLIEISNNEFVRQNYSPSFLEGYILASVLGNLFDSHKRYDGKYRGYTERDIYKPKTTYHTPTAQEKKVTPPITTQGSGSIIKRSDRPSSTSNSGNTSVGTNESTTKKGKIVKSSDEGALYNQRKEVKPSSSDFSRPQSNSPPRVSSGGSGKITKRR